MNRIVIIGNGFDLANGLKTSYSNFLVGYFLEAISVVDMSGKNYDDRLISCKRINNFPSRFTKKLYDTIEFIDFINHGDVYIEGVTKTSKHHSRFEITIKSNFFRRLLCEDNWTDIERCFFNYLLDLKQSRFDEKLEELNGDFDFLKSKLQSYISGLDLEVLDYDKICEKLLSYVRYEFSKEYLFISRSGNDYQRFDKYIFVNFNYTTYWCDHIREYLQNHADYSIYRSIVINIHGDASKTDDIIFGYGDETHIAYKDLENLDDSRFLLNMKSFYYALNLKYTELLNYLNDDFDVSIVGHSLGLSDRILLKTIFEHDKCRAIRIFHRGNEPSYFNKVIALSRHFDNKVLMRSRVVPYVESYLV